MTKNEWLDLLKKQLGLLQDSGITQIQRAIVYKFYRLEFSRLYSVNNASNIGGEQCLKYRFRQYKTYYRYFTEKTFETMSID